MYHVIVPELITEARGLRTMQAIVDASGGQFTLAALSIWEKGKVQPKRKNIEALCAALGVSYNKIAMPKEKVPETSKFFLYNLK